MDDADFMREIVAHPDDDAPRLVYADWLDENGRSERAEFIRVQCELARRSANDPLRAALKLREAELLEAHQYSWVPSDELALFFEWRRGFVAVLNPCARGVFEGKDSLKVLAEFPLAEELHFSFCMRDEEFQHMPDLPNLRFFSVEGNTWITNASLPRIGRWRTLRRLGLNTDSITNEGLPYIAGLTELKVLDLSYSGVSDEGLSRLVPLPALESLDLSDTFVNGTGLAALRAFPNLRRLNLTGSHVWEHGIGGLVGCESLEELRLGTDQLDRPLGDLDLAPLMEMTAIRVLDLGWWCEASPAFLEALWQQLPLEELSYNDGRHTRVGQFEPGAPPDQNGR